MSDSRSLETIQHWLHAVITHPDGIDAGCASATATRAIDIRSNEIDRVVHPSLEMTGRDRLQIYGRAYFGRLLECLKAQFPAVCHSIGDEAFDGLAFGYLIQHPSTSYSLASLGSSFESYLLATRPARHDDSDSTVPDFADFLIDLTRLERIYNEVFDGPGPERVRSLDITDFTTQSIMAPPEGTVPAEPPGQNDVRSQFASQQQRRPAPQGLLQSATDSNPATVGEVRLSLAPEDFANSFLIMHNCVRLLEFRYPVHEFATAIRRGLDPVPPDARPVFLVVTRRDYVVRRFEVSKPQFQVLLAIERRATVGEAIETLYADSAIDIRQMTINVREWFQDWSAAPLFSGFSRCDQPVRSPERGA